MFLERYEKFKKNFENNTNVYEDSSIGDNPLFGLNSYFSEEYFNNDMALSMDFINEFSQELYNTLLKYQFISSYLKEHFLTLEEESKKLDNEYIELCKNVSLKGQAFLDMFSLPEHYNYVIDAKTVYLKNVIEYQNLTMKTNETMSELIYYLNYINSNSFFINLDDYYKINSLFLSFYNQYTISIFGVQEDGTMENLFDEVNTSQEIFLNGTETKYKKLYIISKSPIVEYIKDIKVFSYQKNDSEKYGYLIKKLDNLETLNTIIIVNDVNTSFYMYSEKEYVSFIKQLSINEELAKEQYINENFKINTNEEIILENTNKLYILEFFDYNNHKSYNTNFYAKEK